MPRGTGPGGRRLCRSTRREWSSVEWTLQELQQPLVGGTHGQKDFRLPALHIGSVLCVSIRMVLERLAAEGLSDGALIERDKGRIARFGVEEDSVGVVDFCFDDQGDLRRPLDGPCFGQSRRTPGSG